MRTDVEIPYGAYWSSPFVRWQGALADLHSLEFAAHLGRSALSARDINVGAFDLGVLGATVPQKGSFYGLPWLMGMMGADDVAGPTINQACATGARIVTLAGDEIAQGRARCVLAIAADRVSNGPQILYPAANAPGGAAVFENWVLDNFLHDPLAGCAMVDTAENVARRYGISKEEQHDLVLMRYAQYQDALIDDRAFQRRYMPLPLALPTKGRAMGVTVQGDEGIYPTTAEKLAGLKPVREGGTVTYGAQTHPADGSAAIVLAAGPQACDMSGDPTLRITLIASGQSRAERAHMPEAPIPATRQALKAADLKITDMAAIKSHNPFAVNDIAFCRAFGIKLSMMNNYGCSLIWGHPQAPTGVRAIIELIEELVLKGGGYGLFQGCAAGDSAMAVIIKVEDRPK